jgi:hypothetical protein
LGLEAELMFEFLQVIEEASVLGVDVLLF